MADRWALVIAIDKHLDPALGTTPYSESGARSVADALASAGYAKQVVLLGPQATKAAIESRLRKLKRGLRKGDELLVAVTGRGFSHAGRGHLTCWDTLADDLADTSIPVAELLGTLAGTKAAHVTVLLDVGAGSELRGVTPHLDSGELERLLADSAKVVALASSSADEESHPAAGLKASVWTGLVVDALAGRAARALDRDGRLTALTLHQYLADELPRALRKHYEVGATQEPQLHGEQNAGHVIADLSHRSGHGGLLDPARLRRVAFRTESLGRVKDLTGWRKTYDLPDSARQSARRFVARVANIDVKSDLDVMYEAARESLGYKRKELDVSMGPDGVGTLRTPDFEYTVTATLDADDPTRVAWRREAGRFADPGFVRGPGFDALFGKLFDQLVFEFATPLDVEALVDRLEDRPLKGVKVQVSSDGTSCEITLAGYAGRVTVDRHLLTVRGRAGNSAGLLDQFLAILTTVGPLGEQAALPPAR